MSDNKRVIANNIQRYMDLAGVNRYDVCTALGFKYSTLSDWLQGRKYPRMDKVDALAAYFHCTRSDLVDPPTQSGIQIAGNVSGAVVNNGTVNITNSRLIERYNALPESARLIIDQLIDQLSGGKP